MGWETRIFFDIGNNETVAEQLTLSVVASHVLPGMTALDKDAEQRRDDYVILHDCPEATKIGLKARAVQKKAYYTLLELKTVVDDSNKDDKTAPPTFSALQRWTKSGAYQHGETTDPQLWLEFLNARLQQPLARAARDCMTPMASSVPLLCADKKRRCAKWKRFSVEETDIVSYSVSADGDDEVNGTIKTTRRVLRSWAVEGNDRTDALVELAGTWTERYNKAVAAIGMKEKDAPRMWIASYPAMVILLSEMISKNPPAKKSIPKQH